jgi:4-amino-4-deoxy-L-arabinose transferase-like glycosyltransferase
MANSGLSWITTYDGSPDHWNTKPPLLIWLMSLSIDCFGASELSVRIPSVMAAMATIVMVFSFAAFYLKRPLIGFFAVLLLLANLTYIQTHGARSGNYDSILALFTTGFLFSGYLYLKDNKHRTLWLSLCMLSIFLAFFTKTIQGMIFIPALVMYALYKRQYFILKCPLVYFYAILILSVCMAYYFLRNQIDSGYLDAAISNDLLGRFGKVIEDHSGGSFYYLKYIWVMLTIGIIGLQFKQRNHSDISDFSVFLSVAFLFYLLVISAASTKLYWYVIPLAPLASMLIAIAFYQLIEDKLFKATVLGINRKLIVFLTTIFVGLLIFAYNARYIEQKENDSKMLVADQYNYFLRSKFVKSGKIQKFAVVHPGYENNNSEFYIAPALFYINILRKSMDVAVLQTDAALPNDYQYLLFCGKEIQNSMETQADLKAIEIEGQCGMYAIVGRKAKS